VVLANRPTAAECNQMLSFGATACLSKETEARDIINAIHLASRVMATATEGGIVVSQTVKDLAFGSAIRFDDLGEHVLRGVPSPWRLYRVIDDH
jgi:hypothetical protein